MDYLQYSVIKYGPNGWDELSFKPYYKWITFNMYKYRNIYRLYWWV